MKTDDEICSRCGGSMRNTKSVAIEILGFNVHDPTAPMYRTYPLCKECYEIEKPNFMTEQEMKQVIAVGEQVRDLLSERG